MKQDYQRIGVFNFKVMQLMTVEDGMEHDDATELFNFDFNLYLDSKREGIERKFTFA